MYQTLPTGFMTSKTADHMSNSCSYSIHAANKKANEQTKAVDHDRRR